MPHRSWASCPELTLSGKLSIFLSTLRLDGSTPGVGTESFLQFVVSLTPPWNRLCCLGGRASLPPGGRPQVLVKAHSFLFPPWSSARVTGDKAKRIKSQRTSEATGEEEQLPNPPEPGLETEASSNHRLWCPPSNRSPQHCRGGLSEAWGLCPQCCLCVFPVVS